jgi:uracil phosphoribosyltransferase
VQDKSPLNYTYPFYSTSPTSISLIPILRSGLSMIDALSSLLPQTVPIHHLGLYREKSTLQPVEYYNNLPYVKSSSSGRGGSAGEASSGPAELAIVVDPVIATGATSEAAVETLRDWGVNRVIVIAVIGSTDGVRRVAESWIEDGVSKVELFVGGCDDETDANGMIKPGLGDVGDRLFLSVGK